MAITVMDWDHFCYYGVFPAKKRGFRWHYEIYRDGVRMTRDCADTFDEVRNRVQNFMMHYRSDGGDFVLRVLPRSTMIISAQEGRPLQENIVEIDQGRDSPTTDEYGKSLRSLLEKIQWLRPIFLDPPREDPLEILALLPPWPMEPEERTPPQEGRAPQVGAQSRDSSTFAEDPNQWRSWREETPWKWLSLVEKLRDYGPLLRDLLSWSVGLEESIPHQERRAVRGELNLLESLGELHQCRLRCFDHLDHHPRINFFSPSVEIFPTQVEREFPVKIFLKKLLSTVVARSRDSATTAEDPDHRRSLRGGNLERLSVSPTVGLLLVVFVFSPFHMASAAPVSLHVEVRGLAVQGRPYTLTCVVTPAPPPDTTLAYTWHKGGHDLKNQTGRVLTFTTVSKSDEGHYQCGLNLGRLQLSDSLSLRVIVFEKLSMVSEVEVEEGQTVILNCSVHSDPTAFLNWRVDGELVLTVRSNSYGLVLHNASRLHLSVVECQAYNEALPLGFMSTYTLIRIKGTYEIIPRPWLGPRGTPVLHRPFGMECLVMDIPNRGVNMHLTYTWYKDHKVIEGQSDMILDIPSVRKEDSGLYTCTARNGKPRTTSLESNALEVVVLVPPVVQIEPQTPDQTVLGATEHNLTLTCKVTEAFPGVASDGYRWSYLPSPQAQLRPLEGRESTLTLGPLTREDRGQYFCQAWNYEDFDGLLPPGNASVTVDVLYLGHISLTPDLKVNKGEHVTLTCEVDCNPPARLAWIVGGVEVRHVTGKVDHYVISEASYTDSQTYVCSASNPDLPGLERTASTHVLVNCSSPGEEGVTAELPAHTTEQTAAEGNSTSLKIALPIVFGALAVIVVTVLVVCLKKRRGKSPKDDVSDIASEEQPMNGPGQLA